MYVFTGCTAGKYGHYCNETCSCGDRAKTCDPENGCIDCVEGWEGEQCQDDINECTVNDPCGDHAKVSVAILIAVINYLIQFWTFT